MNNKLSPSASAALAEASDEIWLARGELLFREGEQSSGAYIVNTGTVKLFATSSAGKALTVRTADPGDIIGLSAALAGCRNDTSADALEPASVCYVTTDSLYRLMSCYNDLSLWLAEQLSTEYFCLCRELSLLGRGRTAMSRLARLLVGFVEKAGCKHSPLVLKCRLTHEEMAQMIGTSRETVTRLLSELRETAIASLNNNTLQVNNFDRLQALTH